MATTRKSLSAEQTSLKPNARSKPPVVVMDPAAIAAAEAAAAETTANAAFNSTVTGAHVVSDDMVVVNVPKGFILTLDDFTPVSYPAGTVKMPRAHAEHPYAVARGITTQDQ
jgi:hypothetical protein